MEYLNTFDTMQDYLDAKDNLTLPSASLIEETKEVIYDKYDPYNGYDFVEIGGKKWATMNVGANSITEGGLYFQWADAQGYTRDQAGSGEGKKYFDWVNYKYGNGTSSPGTEGMSKYNGTDQLTELEDTDDAAHIIMKGEWRTPTNADFAALQSATTQQWVTDYEGSGMNGLLFTDNTDNSKKLFFPAAGYGLEGGVGSYNSNGVYWYNKVYSTCTKAYSLDFVSNSQRFQATFWRYLGYNIRAVMD